MTEEHFRALLLRPEGETLDFKAREYDLKNIEKRLDLIKDVLAMANTPREEGELSYLVLGVKRNRDGSTEFWGLQHFVDDADIQSQFSERVSPIPSIAYHTFEVSGKAIGVIEISRDLNGPFTLSKNFGSMGKGQIYFRRGSKNEVATGDDIRRIMDWFKSQGRLNARLQRKMQAWAPFLEAVSSFDPRRRYLLVTSPIRDALDDRIEALARVPWISVLDFDPDSESEGLLGRIKEGVRTQRSLHLAVKGEVVMAGAGSTTWFFARGLRGRHETLQEGPYKDWFRAYSAEIDRHFSKLAAGINPFPVTIVVLWYDPTLTEHLRRTLDVAVTHFHDTANLVVASAHVDTLQSVADPLGVPLVEIPLHDLCAGIATHYEDVSAEAKSFRFPGSTDAGALIDQEKARWLQEDLELADLGAGQQPSTDADPRKDFLIGREVTWDALALHADVDRDLTKRVETDVEETLGRGRTVRINLYHAPGAGGTTVGKRVVWNLHAKYPAAVMSRCVPSDTANRLYYLTSETRLSVLIMVDGAQVSERQIDELYTELRARHVPVVLLQVLRRFGPPGGDRYYLPTELSRNETAKFFHIFGHAEPSRRAQLERLADSLNPQERSAFFFGLTTYGKDFKGLESYVRQRLDSVTDELRRVAVFLAIAHRYAQRELPGQIFADLLGIPKNRPVDVRQLLPSDFHELFVEGRDGMWRTAHELVATEILEQLLGDGHPERWKQGLSIWAKQFAHLCRGDQTSDPSDEMLEVARRTFIYRDNADLLGTERSGTNRFAQLIEDIQVKEGCLEVLKEVVTLFPNEAHFWAHLGRFYAFRVADYVEALRCNDRAISLQENDNVLHHMRAMTLRQAIYAKIDDRVAIADMLEQVRQASGYFEDARRLNPQDEHSYISEVQMVIRVLDYAVQSSGKDLATYLSSQEDSFLREALDRCETLLETARRNREGEGSSNYERDCRARLDSLYGKFGRALQTWDNLLQRRDVYAPPVRRQIVWTFLRRAKDWDSMPVREVDRTVALLEDNLEAEPNNERDLRLWIQAVRKSSRPPNVDSVIERVAYWKANSGSLEATYYLYVLNALKTLDGSPFAREDALRYIDESRLLARTRRNRTRSFEWFGTGSAALAKLVSHSSLGEWDDKRNFWSNTLGLARVTGRVSRIDGPQAGLIEVPGGLTAFFVPAVGNFTELNVLVECFLGFSYDGIRAWEVKPFVG